MVPREVEIVGIVGGGGAADVVVRVCDRRRRDYGVDHGGVEGVLGLRGGEWGEDFVGGGAEWVEVV